LQKLTPRFKKIAPKKNFGMYGDTGTPETKTATTTAADTKPESRCVPPSR